MKAILLAAGVGKRLRSVHAGPKCLLRFGDRTLLDRHLDNLAALGIEDVTLCLGHDPDAVIAAVARRAARAPLVHFNPLYQLGSVVSLYCARHTLAAGDDVLVMDADVLYHPHILERLVASAHRHCFLFDPEFVPGDEPVKLCLRDSRIVEFRKQLDPGLSYNRVGESVGFFRFGPDAALHLARLVAAYSACERRELPHEEALRELALANRFDIGVEDVGGLPWIEIDFPEDITRASQEILPRIDEQ